MKANASQQRTFLLQVLAPLFALCLLCLGGLPAHAQDKKYTAIGDSLTVGLYADATPASDGTYPNGFAAQVRNELVATRGYSAANYRNRGVTGTTAPGVASGQLAAAIADAPDLVTLTVGSNDVIGYFQAQGAADATKAAAFKTAFQTALNQILSGLRNGAPSRFILLSNVPKLWLLPAVYGQVPDMLAPTVPGKQAVAQSQIGLYVTAANEAIASETATSNARVVDIFSDDTITAPTNISPVDGFHPSRTGHDGLAQKFLISASTVPETPSLVVTSKTDVTANDGRITLREAIVYARTFPAGQNPNVTFAGTVTGTITLGGSNINISRPAGSTLTISGPGAEILSLNGDARSNIFFADGVGNAALSGLSFTNGRAASGGAIRTVPNSSDREASGTLRVTDCIFSQNHATTESGALDGGSVVQLLRCSFLNNTSDQFEGAFQFYSYSETRPSSATDCVFVGNTAPLQGGAVAIFSDGLTTLTRCVFTGNSVTSASEGGALFIKNDFDDGVALVNCTFNDNRATGGQGGAIRVEFCPNLTLTNCLLAGNRATNGGGLDVNTAVNVTLNGCTLRDNVTTANGGGIRSASPVSLLNTTLSGNTASALGGGVYLTTANSAALTAQFTTFAANSATEGGGIYLSDGKTGNLARSIVAANTAATNPDVGGAFTSGGFNVIGKVGSATGFISSDLTGTMATPLDARLAALADNGGATPTHALLTSSPALDLAPPVVGINTDQRGAPRPNGANADAGAFEAQLPTIDLNGADAGINITAAFTEQTPLIIAPDVIVTSDSGLNGATVQLNENPGNALETLGATTTGTAITATYNSTTRTLTLSGGDTLANYRQVLASVVYNNTSDTPNPTNRTIAFSIANGAQSSTLALATVTITKVNDAPVATAQALSTDEDTPLNLTLSASDVDTAAANLTFRIVTAPAHGTLTGTLPNLVYTPAANFNGLDSLVFVANDGTSDSTSATIALQVLAANDAPVAAAQSVATAQNTPLNIVLSATDIDTPAANLTFRIVTPPTKGTLTGTIPNLIYTPKVDFSGLDSFAFVANDGTADSAPATIAITVTANPSSPAPVAQAQSVATDEDTPLSITLTSNATPASNPTYTVTTAPANGTLTGTAPNLTYTPSADFNGSDSLAFRVENAAGQSNIATIAITIRPVNDAPIVESARLRVDKSTPLLLTLRARDVDGDALTYFIGQNLPDDQSEAGKGLGPLYGTLTGTAPNLTYTPPANYLGRDVFTFYVSDGTTTSRQAKIEILVTGERSLSAGDDSYNLILGAPDQEQQSGITLLSSGVFRIDAPGVLANDFRGAGIDKATPKLAQVAKNGRVQLRADGAFDYLPSSGFAGTDIFAYRISDGKTSATARVRLIVIDRRAPQLRFDTPANGATVKTISAILGRVRDRESGLKSLTLLWQRFDGKFWNGNAWIDQATPLLLTVSGINWSYNGTLPTVGDDEATDLLDGDYALRVTATDKSNNVTRLTNRVRVVNSAPPAPTFSPVRLSSASASSAQNALTLRFTGALDEEVAHDTMNYAISVNNVALGIGEVSANGDTVVLSGFAFAQGDAIKLSIIGLRDAEGQTLRGGTIDLKAR